MAGVAPARGGPSLADPAGPAHRPAAHHGDAVAARPRGGEPGVDTASTLLGQLFAVPSAPALRSEETRCPTPPAIRPAPIGTSRSCC